MEWMFCLSTAICAIYIGCVVAQQTPDLGDDVGQLGDLLGQLDLGDINIGTDGPMEGEVTAPILTCYECGTSAELDKAQLERSCTEPSRATLNGTVCRPPPPGVVNHCGWMEATVSTPNPDTPEMNMELYWLFRGCVPIPTNLEVGDKCFNDADLVTTLDDLGMSLEEIVGAGESSTITGKGCFCGKDYCNGASTVWSPPLSTMLVMVAAACAVLF